MHDIRARRTRPYPGEASPKVELGVASVSKRKSSKEVPRNVSAGATGAIVIDLAQIRANWRALAHNVAPAECGAVVKADAYGVGAARIIPALADAGCRSFFVATPEEARDARALATDAAIYVLDGLLPGTARQLVSISATPVLASLGEVREWAAHTSDDTDLPPAALHIDTGLNRLGMRQDEVEELSRDAALLARLRFALVMSHLACADEAGHPMNLEQIDTFNRLRATLPFAPASIVASDGMMLGAEYHCDLVRPGYSLYGGQAAPERLAPVGPVVRVSARILQVRDVARGDRIGYSASYRAHKARRIATVAAGYADGVFRHASSTDEEPGGAVSIGGKHAPIVGRVSMDLITVDVTDIDNPAPAPGDWVDLVGPELAIETVGASAMTIGYEVLTRLGSRFHRIYLDQSD
ncbi:MAG: alanine racemase [Hyphomicrobium sp.]|nr:alanine racemase [Hyphomicrobium sp.]